MRYTEKPLDFRGNPDPVTLGLGLQLDGAPPYSGWKDMTVLPDD